MSAVLASFGIDWRLLIINTINFALLLLALWYFLYGPLMRMLEERRAKVAQGVVDAEAAAQKLRMIEEEKAGILGKAGQEADDVLQKARTAAAEKERGIVAASEARAAALLSDAGKEAKELKRQAIEESKQEVAKLVVLGIEKMLASK
ncbi:MAG: F0F1 ATP synthase subunit B [Patescibacteria group bacterium]|nr:F0F1 ATP synthase subunit B [Patescibacteria group bacterium]